LQKNGINVTPTEASQSGQADKILGVEATVKRALKPVPPPPVFRERLRDGLVMAAHHQRTHHALGYTQPRRNRFQWIWLTGAVAIGTALGFIAIRLHTRQ
jgi:hypothetical protein